MVVDDDALVLSVVARKIHAFGYTPDTAGDVAEAVKMASAHDYDVVIADLLMPQLNGIELMARLAESSSVTSFILMTGANDFHDHDSRSVDGRLTAVLSKPFDDAELDKALKQAFDVAGKRRAISEKATSSIDVLLLEDSLSDALLTQHALHTLGGYRVTHVVRLADAVKLLHESTFDTIITDLSLPDARGLDAVMKVRHCAPEATLLVCSSVEDEAMALRVIELGAQDFIVKNAGDSETLGRAIRFARVRRQGERRLAQLAHSDPLTGLANRAAFAERLDQALAQAKRDKTQLGVMFIDLDGFKAINDSRGHDAGDVLLRETALRIRDCLREYDVVARLGGDEFAVVVVNNATNTLEPMAQRIGRAISAPVGLDSGLAQVTASIGVAGFPDNADKAVLLLKLADEAMYEAKRAGKGCVRQAGYCPIVPEVEFLRSSTLPDSLR